MNVKQKSAFSLFAGKLRTISVIILLVITYSFCQAQNNTKPTTNKSTVKKQVAKEEVFGIVEEMPEFPGGFDAINAFIKDNRKYPFMASENGIEGTVYVRIIIKASGMVKVVGVIRAIDPDLDKEALRVVGLLPKFKPGMQKGKAVSVYITLPIKFEL